MRQLAGLDAGFLYLETPEMPMHVGALHVLELPAGFQGRFVDLLRAHIAARLPHLPALRRRLASVPLDLFNPAWVAAEPDLAQHIVAIELPPGSAMRALQDAVGRLHGQLLDRERPLWKFHVFENLAPGNEGQRYVALYTQLHHAAVDGQAAVALASVILDLSPEPRELPAKPARAARTPLGPVGLLRGALAHQWQQTMKLARALPGSVGTLSQLASQSAGEALSALAGRWRGEASGAGSSDLLAPRMRFNQSISAARSFASLSLPLAGLNEARKRHGASLNDAVLMVCGSALRRLLLELGELPKKPLIAAVPISLREAGDTRASNQVSMTRVSLATHIADPRRRLAQLLQASAAMKQGMGAIKDLMPEDFPSPGLPWLLAAAAKLYGRAHLAERVPPLVNLVISNVPGPAMPLYLAGARMLTNAPASIVVHGIALNITVQSYNGMLEVGLMACAEVLPDTQALAAHLQAAYDEFLALKPVAARPHRPVAQGTGN
ncbi:wax ester/triacylglycerol synthase family O-acyltransferase [Paucibacter sp. APW11]|uniref:diacylglycerol O-acyltransferase n=1 Tax=Roseateles aquae TaxID=3077235 RepID=A0ABU3PI16_9BURK|nr:wax ester/triacylglycerol synthase family O-acyltransferase [Paucibacter sp. APW11]MDT9002230.1 wax ester/triacylglycerol synthase family O-acyltransferase [Paucibacter sp. APW11]